MVTQFILLQLNEKGQVVVNCQGFDIHQTIGILSEAHKSVLNHAINPPQVVETVKDGTGTWAVAEMEQAVDDQAEMRNLNTQEEEGTT